MSGEPRRCGAFKTAAEFEFYRKICRKCLGPGRQEGLIKINPLKTGECP